MLRGILKLTLALYPPPVVKAQTTVGIRPNES
jgi:hypothetical protein